MSGAPPAFSPTAAPPVVTRIGAPPAPTFVTTPIPGPIGASGQQGPQGIQGPQGEEKGFGSIRYAETAGTVHVLQPGVRTLFTLTPTATIDTRRAPFTGFAYWANDNTLRNRMTADIFLVRMRMLAMTTVSGGTFHMEFVQAGAGAGALIASYDKSFVRPAGTTESVDPQFIIPTQQAFQDNGGHFYMQSSVPVTLFNEIMVIVPISAGG